MSIEIVVNSPVGRLTCLGKVSRSKATKNPEPAKPAPLPAIPTQTSVPARRHRKCKLECKLTTRAFSLCATGLILQSVWINFKHY